MAQKPSPGYLPCLFCGRAFRDSALLTMHLDLAHENWVGAVMESLGLTRPSRYPIKEYRRALAEAFVGQESASHPPND